MIDSSLIPQLPTLPESNVLEKLNREGLINLAIMQVILSKNTEYWHNAVQMLEGAIYLKFDFDDQYTQEYRGMVARLESDGENTLLAVDQAKFACMMRFLRRKGSVDVEGVV